MKRRNPITFRAEPPLNLSFRAYWGSRFTGYRVEPAASFTTIRVLAPHGEEIEVGTMAAARQVIFDRLTSEVPKL
jgi:hypothetical protein